jgi:hypothetical protein
MGPDCTREMTMNLIAKLNAELNMMYEYAREARMDGADADYIYWMDAAADMQAHINELVREQIERENAEEGRIARQNRIADIASGRYRVTAH